jgi:hypothetical protein
MLAGIVPMPGIATSHGKCLANERFYLMHFDVDFGEGLFGTFTSDHYNSPSQIHYSKTRVSKIAKTCNAKAIFFPN